MKILSLAYDKAKVETKVILQCDQVDTNTCPPFIITDMIILHFVFQWKFFESKLLVWYVDYGLRNTFHTAICVYNTMNYEL